MCDHINDLLASGGIIIMPTATKAVHSEHIKPTVADFYALNLHLPPLSPLSFTAPFIFINIPIVIECDSLTASQIYLKHPVQILISVVTPQQL